MWLKLKSLLTARLNVWIVFIIIGLLGWSFLCYQHIKQDHELLHVLVNVMNQCYTKPDCKALLFPAVPGK